MKHTLALACAAVIASLTATPSANAAVTIRDVAVRNASFEDPSLGNGQFVIGSFDGWSANGSGASSGALNPTLAMLPAVPDGANIGFISAYDFQGEQRAGSMFQTLTEQVAAGTTYAFSVDVSRRVDVATLGRWTAELLAGGAVVASGTLTDADVTAGTFRTLGFGYTGTAADAGQALGIRFRSFYDAGQSPAQVALDKVRLTATNSVSAVPEPATWAMMLGGFGLVGATMRRRRLTQMRVIC